MGDCGQIVEVRHDGREYLRRLPAHCEPGAPLAAPLLVLVHCFGCTALMELEKFAPAADRLGFVLAAPVGLHSSFNAPNCCGFAHATGIDDVGFVDSLVRHMQGAVVSTPTPLFASGFSNGGFLVSTLPAASRLKWMAIAPTAGHEYAPQQPKRPTAVYMHHCAADASVSISGCCKAQQCCCGIGAEQDECVSTTELHRRWLDLNQCRSSVSARGAAGAECVVGVGCAVNTTLCLHAHCVHAAWARQFDAAHDVVEFMAREACELHGRWNAGRGTCACPAEWRGRYCLRPSRSHITPPHARRRW